MRLFVKVALVSIALLAVSASAVVLGRDLTLEARKKKYDAQTSLSKSGEFSLISTALISTV
jgi:hypothetical protein